MVYSFLYCVQIPSTWSAMASSYSVLTWIASTWKTRCQKESSYATFGKPLLLRRLWNSWGTSTTMYTYLDMLPNWNKPVFHLFSLTYVCFYFKILFVKKTWKYYTRRMVYNNYIHSRWHINTHTLLQHSEMIKSWDGPYNKKLCGCVYIQCTFN